MSKTKRVSITVDEDLVEYIKDVTHDKNLSVNKALRYIIDVFKEQTETEEIDFSEVFDSVAINCTEKTDLDYKAISDCELSNGIKILVERTVDNTSGPQLVFTIYAQKGWDYSKAIGHLGIMYNLGSHDAHSLTRWAVSCVKDFHDEE
jgi:hypothetical protein